ncbi:MAG: DUF4276 family protein [Caldilineae bacterium]|nr:MAG: DUF4276 family protein [Caldilineae bacterium]
MPELWLWVEGEGERPDPKTGKGGGATVLVRRILHERLAAYDWNVTAAKVGDLNAFRRKMQRMVAYLKHRQEEAALVLLDLDDGCAAIEAQALVQDLRALSPPKPIAVVFAVREFEAWFLAAASSLWGEEKAKAYPHPPESKRDAKGEIQRYFQDDYTPTSDQASLAARMDLAQAQAHSRSFRRLLHAVEELIQAVQNGQKVVTP